MKLGFIGLGVMGRPMALHLMKHGHSMGVYARRAESSAPLVASVSGAGLVKALSAGTAEIQASAFGQTAGTTITVTGVVDTVTAGALAFTDIRM